MIYYIFISALFSRSLLEYNLKMKFILNIVLRIRNV